MKAFQVPTRPVSVEVFLADGRQLSGRMFLAENPRVDGNTGLLMGSLNDPREFIPFEVGDERGARSLVLNKDHIVRVRLAADTQAARETPAVSEAEVPPVAAGAAGETAVLHLSDGSRITGQVAVQTPESLSRAVDKLNCAPRFLPVVRDDGVDVVQRCHVTTLD